MTDPLWLRRATDRMWLRRLVAGYLLIKACDCFAISIPLLVEKWLAQ